MAADTLVLHVGIHKTASTYIQHRLKGNRLFLRRQGLLYPKRRRDHLKLVKALERGQWQPWQKLLDRAARKGRMPLVSAEILSVLLPENSPRGNGQTLLAELVQALAARGVALHLIGFIRDQPAYLNSRYTQLIKRFYFTLPFPRYVNRTMRGNGRESACNYERLFGEALDHPAVQVTLLPFRSGEADPCERLLQAMGVSDCRDLRPLQQQANAQPGWQAVWIAQRIGRRLRRHHPQAWRNGRCKARIRDRLEQLAAQQGWPAEPFQGLTPQLLAEIEAHYGPSNQRLAQRVWGCSWRELFASPTPQPSPNGPRNARERQQLVALADQLLAEGLQDR